jgi:hypothetical protein
LKRPRNNSHLPSTGQPCAGGRGLRSQHKFLPHDWKGIGMGWRATAVRRSTWESQVAGPVAGRPESYPREGSPTLGYVQHKQIGSPPPLRTYFLPVSRTRIVHVMAQRAAPLATNSRLVCRPHARRKLEIASGRANCRGKIWRRELPGARKESWLLSNGLSQVPDLIAVIRSTSDEPGHRAQRVACRRRHAEEKSGQEVMFRGKRLSPAEWPAGIPQRIFFWLNAGIDGRTDIMRASKCRPLCAIPIHIHI